MLVMVSEGSQGPWVPELQGIIQYKAGGAHGVSPDSGRVKIEHRPPYIILHTTHMVHGAFMELLACASWTTISQQLLHFIHCLFGVNAIRKGSGL
jgi:hypothetical protein